MASKKSAKKGFFGTGANDPDMDPSDRWEQVPAGIVHQLVVVATRAGGAVLFGRSRDGGVPSLTLYTESERSTFYFRPGEDVEENLRFWISQYEGLLEDRKSA